MKHLRMANHLRTHSKSIQNGLKEFNVDQRKFKRLEEKKKVSYPINLLNKSIPNFLFEEGEKQNEEEDVGEDEGRKKGYPFEERKKG